MNTYSWVPHEPFEIPPWELDQESLRSKFQIHAETGFSHDYIKCYAACFSFYEIPDKLLSYDEYIQEQSIIYSKDFWNLDITHFLYSQIQERDLCKFNTKVSEINELIFAKQHFEIIKEEIILFQNTFLPSKVLPPCDEAIDEMLAKMQAALDNRAWIH